MRERHQVYRPVPGLENKRLAAANPYGLLTEEQARTDGYGITGEAFEKNSQGVPSDPNKGIVQRLSKGKVRAWEKDLSGSRTSYTKVTAPSGSVLQIPKSGCVRLANSQFYGEKWDALYFVVQDLANQVIAKTEESRSVRAAVQRWSKCMRAHGHPGLTSLQDPRRQITNDLKAAGDDTTKWKTLGSHEISLAQQDYTCERASKVHETVNIAQSVAEHQILTPRWAAAVEQFRELRKKADRRVSLDRDGEAVVGSPGESNPGSPIE
ncbi:hypothetical protein [Streptomyces sp. NPDC005799]|uniref:hypothetical protein n=1 Tax=Streptomyces sp. NPDC005799 TaxID=3154678 RepID=UPI0033DDBE8F